MSSIVQLDQNTINKIAAGEVIERPSAVVKELVENAIDAGANAITIEIKEGGVSLVRITDNGKGIAKDDIKIAFLRHATSKITSVEDLFMVKSLGFRGEALSSIAAVAQVELITKTAEELTGVRYVIEGGKEQSMEDIGCPNGTTFIVKNLFYNTPVRRKFLKTSNTEAGYVFDLLERLAVSHPDISFKFVNNGQIKLQTQGNNKLKDIIYSIYGREIYNNMVEVNAKRRNVSMKGFIGKPIISRGNRNYENYFINGRYIKSNVIYKAIEEAYKPYSMVHRYPFVSLHLDISQELIDVNVHPTKMEIRFANSQEVYEIVYSTIKDALDNSKRIPNVELVKENEDKKDKKRMPEPFEVNRRKEEKLNIPIPTTLKEDGQSYYFEKVEEGEVNITEGFSREKYAVDNKNIFDTDSQKTEYTYEKFIEKEIVGNNNKTENNIENKNESIEFAKEKILEDIKDDDNIDTKRDILAVKENNFIKNKLDSKDKNEVIENSDTKISFDVEDILQKDIKENKTKESTNEYEKIENLSDEYEKNTKKDIDKDISVEQNIEKNKAITAEQVDMFEDIEVKKELKIVGQVFNTYWIVEYDEKMFIIDQHAAHEKVMYERIMKSYKEKKHNSQVVAPPIVISLNMREESALKKNLDMFKDIGFEIEHFGGRDYIINAVPLDMYGIADKVLFMEILDSLVENEYRRTPDVVMEKIASMSCKAAVKGNNKLSLLEAKELLSEMFELENPYNCPHGRPTVIELTKKELEKKFKRVL